MEDVSPVAVLPVMDEAERRALIVRPARRRRWARIAECYAVGLVLGPIVSALVNHGHLHLASSPDTLLVLSLIAILSSGAIMSDRYGDKRAAVVRAIVIAPIGSALFMLPRSAMLVAVGSPFSWPVIARWLIYAVPFPLVADAIRPGSSRPARIAPLIGLACLALVWPLLMSGMVDAAAAQTRAAVGAPDAMLFFIDPPAPSSIESADYKNGTLLLQYGSLPLTDWPEYDRAFADIDMVVYPAQAATPCSSTTNALSHVFGGGSAAAPGQTCSQVAPGLWQITGLPMDGWTTEIEKHGAYYVALIGGSQNPVSPTGLIALFRTVHRPDNAELVALGRADTALWFGSDQGSD
jgi:hypothetical protein